VKIRDKLFLAFGFYIFLAVVLGFLAYKELQAIATRLVLVETANDISNNFLEVRRHEKNFLLFRDKDSLQELKKNLEKFKNNINAIGLEIVKEMGDDDYRMIKEAIIGYEYLTDRINESGSIDNMRSMARVIQSFAENLSKKEMEKISALLTNSRLLFLYAIFIILIVGGIINMKLAVGIARPLRLLEKRTREIAAGSFTEHVEVKGKDELTSLEVAFNEMEDRLRDAMQSLELAVKRLHQKQAQLVETEKLATMGKFAAGVAHEINNPLAIINEKAGLMKDILDMSEDSNYKEKFLGIIHSMLDNVNRCRTITHRILGFSRRMDITSSSFSLNETINEVLEFLERDIEYKNIHMGLQLAPDIPEIRSDKGQIQQVFLNIVKNAIDAVEAGGAIDISTTVKAEQAVVVSIKDNGPGIPEDVIKQIFEPFFTTKAKGKGTGLGLSITYGITRNLGGNIFVKSEVGKGTTFIVEMPVNSNTLAGE